MIRALEILDSRGNPTVRVTVGLSDGASGTASVPSGASTGLHEVSELRDGDRGRFGGLGVRRAIEHVEGVILTALRRRRADQQERLDKVLSDLDGTPDLSRLGANAVLGTSLAAARAAALSAGLPLYAYLRRLAGRDPSDPYLLPVPHLNVMNGGRHADSGLDVQEFLVLPSGAPSFAEAIRAGSEIFHALGNLLRAQGLRTAVGDEGGYAPLLGRNDEAFHLMQRAVELTGRSLGGEVVFGVDVAASELYAAKERAYVLRAPGVTLTTERLVALYAEWAGAWPIRTIEDPLEQDDWEGWAKATEKLAALGVQVVGDDLFATSSTRLRMGMKRRCATALIVKPNQIGTLSGTLAAVRLAQQHGYGVIVSHRSGETGDTFIADLAVAVDAGQIKAGSLCRSERVEKYNRLVEIESELKERASYAGSAALRARTSVARPGA